LIRFKALAFETSNCLDQILPWKSTQTDLPSENFPIWSGGLAANFVIQLREILGPGRKIKWKLILVTDSYGRIDDL
jgi:hypothetical protein